MALGAAPTASCAPEASAIAEALFFLADANGDGVVDRAEWKAFHDDLQHRESDLSAADGLG